MTQHSGLHRQPAKIGRPSMFNQGQKLGIRAATQGQCIAALIANCRPLPPTNRQQVILKHYRPEINFSLACGNCVELRGFEPLAPSMRTRCATGLRYSPNERQLA
jgi:hypothetical protein